MNPAMLMLFSPSNVTFQAASVIKLDFIDSGDDNDDNIDVTECFTEKDKLIILLFIVKN